MVRSGVLVLAIAMIPLAVHADALGAALREARTSLYHVRCGRIARELQRLVDPVESHRRLYHGTCRDQHHAGIDQKRTALRSCIREQSPGESGMVLGSQPRYQAQIHTFMVARGGELDASFLHNQLALALRNRATSCLPDAERQQAGESTFSVHLPPEPTAAYTVTSPRSSFPESTRDCLQAAFEGACLAAPRRAAVDVSFAVVHENTRAAIDAILGGE